MSISTKADEGKAFYVTAGAAQWKERLVTKEDVRWVFACVQRVVEFLDGAPECSYVLVSVLGRAEEENVHCSCLSNRMILFSQNTHLFHTLHSPRMFTRLWASLVCSRFCGESHRSVKLTWAFKPGRI
jgi:hypothetical protein